MARASAGEAGFTFDGQKYTLVFDMAAIANFEDETDMSIIEVGGIIEAAKTGGKPPKLSTLGSLLAAGLSRHHPHIDRVAAMAMFADENVQAALGTSFERSNPQGDSDVPLAKPAHSKKASGTGTR